MPQRFLSKCFSRSTGGAGVSTSTLGPLSCKKGLAGAARVFPQAAAVGNNYMIIILQSKFRLPHVLTAANTP